MSNSDLDELFDDFVKTNPNCVVLGQTKLRYNYENLCRAFFILSSNPDSVLVTMGTGYMRVGVGERL